MVVTGDEYNGNLESNTENPSLVGVALAVGTCVILAFALISCIYFRKWKHRRRPAEDAAFYMNAGFEEFPQGAADLIAAKKMKQAPADPEVFPSNGTALCTLSDLPPHPAADCNKPYPLPYQLDPEGYVEQNLYASQSLSNSPQQVKNNGGVVAEISTNQSEVPPDAASPDILFANPGAKEGELAQGTEVGIADGAESGYETIDLKDSPDEGKESFVIANPAAFKECV